LFCHDKCDILVKKGPATSPLSSIPVTSDNGKENCLTKFWDLQSEPNESMMERLGTFSFRERIERFSCMLFLIDPKQKEPSFIPLARK